MPEGTIDMFFRFSGLSLPCDSWVSNMFEFPKEGVWFSILEILAPGEWKPVSSWGIYLESALFCGEMLLPCGEMLRPCIRGLERKFGCLIMFCIGLLRLYSGSTYLLLPRRNWLVVESMKELAENLFFWTLDLLALRSLWPSVEEPFLILRSCLLDPEWVAWLSLSSSLTIKSDSG